MKKSILMFPFLVYSILTANCVEYSQDSKVKLHNQRSFSNVSGIQTFKNSRNDIPPGSPSPIPESTENIQHLHSLRNTQSRFGVERSFTRKSPIPSAIWRWIIDNEENLDLKAQLLEKNSADFWVYGSQLDLNNDNQADFIVMAHQPPLIGANVTTFWLFLNERGHFRSVLKTTGLELDVSMKRVNGLRSVTTIAFTATTGIEVTFNYDGQHYLPVSQKTEELKPAF